MERTDFSCFNHLIFCAYNAPLICIYWGTHRKCVEASYSIKIVTYQLYHNIEEIIKSEVWPICHWLGHETMVYFVNLWYGPIASWDISVLGVFARHLVLCHWHSACSSITLLGTPFPPTPTPTPTLRPTPVSPSGKTQNVTGWVISGSPFISWSRRGSLGAVVIIFQMDSELAGFYFLWQCASYDVCRRQDT